MYFGVATSSKGSSPESDSEVAPGSKRPRTSSSFSQSKQRRAKSRPVSRQHHYNKKWESKFSRLEYDEDQQGAFCKVCRKWGRSIQKTGGVWIMKLFNNWKKALEKTRAHSQSDGHIQSCEPQLAADTVVHQDSVIQQLQQLRERLKNREAIKSLICCSHCLTYNCIAYTTTFGDCVDLVVSCGGEDVRQFIKNAGRNATNTSKDAVIEFIAAIG